MVAKFKLSLNYCQGGDLSEMEAKYIETVKLIVHKEKQPKPFSPGISRNGLLSLLFFFSYRSG
jgi:hypothetical protein